MCSVLKRKDDVLGIHDVLVGFKQLAVFQHLGDETRNDRATALKASCPSQKGEFCYSHTFFAIMRDYSQKSRTFAPV